MAAADASIERQARSWRLSASRSSQGDPCAQNNSSLALSIIDSLTAANSRRGLESRHAATRRSRSRRRSLTRPRRDRVRSSRWCRSRKRDLARLYRNSLKRQGEKLDAHFRRSSWALRRFDTQNPIAKAPQLPDGIRQAGVALERGLFGSCFFLPWSRRDLTDF